ncbi:MAG: 3-phosphoshikimate 1-carboxyvinyltransferase [Clostridia bacterium]|nr:3-phosphoshikimate 1-carboxyvinyltransferase [Clostridia bacterium]
MSKTVAIYPSKLNGEIIVPPSKSAAHRALICAYLAEGESKISNIAMSEDIKATLTALESIGSAAKVEEDTVYVSGGYRERECVNKDIFCNESGSTLRFIIPILLAYGGEFCLTGAGRLMDRPLDDYYRIFDEKNIKYKKEDNKLFISGKLTPGKFYLSGDVSSQYISGLLFALPLLEGDSEILITTPMESIGYINMTIEMLSKFGVEIKKTEDYRSFVISGNQRYEPQNITVEGDYSQAAFYLVANELGNNINVKGLKENSTQGDKKILEIIDEMRTDKPIHTINVSQIPDLVPILSVLAAKTNGTTHIVGAKRLRLKESDRLHTVYLELKKLGVNIKENDDSLEITGPNKFTGAITESHNDHRIAISLAIASTCADGTVTICGADSVKKSYGDFWDKFKGLGGVVEDVSDIRQNI